MKFHLVFLMLIFSSALIAQKEISNGLDIEVGDIKVGIYYPGGEGKTFDMDYYSEKHMPMAAKLFGEHLKAMLIDKGLTGASPESPATYLAIGYFYFKDLQTFQEQMGKHSETLRADVPNYTNIQPVIQVSTVQKVQ